MVRARYSHGRECPPLHCGAGASAAPPQRILLSSSTLPLGFSTEGGSFVLRLVHLLSIALVAAGLTLPQQTRTAQAQDSGIESVPVVLSFNPVGGPAGTLVQISGTGFTGATAVRF